VLREAVDLDVLKKAPKLPPLPRASNKVPEAPPVEDVMRLLSGSFGWLRTAIALAALVGLRVGEIRALLVGDVDLSEGLLYVRRNYSAGEIVTPKGRHEASVPLAPMLRVILAEVIQGRKPDEPLVLNDRSQTPRTDEVDHKRRRLQRRLGIERVRSIHKLRHFFATALLRGGADVETVRELLRQADLVSTSRYLHATSRGQHAALGTLPQVPLLEQGTCGEAAE
jgi:integrase/recombinase XerD